MSTLDEIESAIKRLPTFELAELYRWFDDYREKAWDAQIASDAKAGKFSRFKQDIGSARASGELIDFP